MIHFLPLQELNARFEPALSEAVLRVVRSGWYLRGAEVRAFENEFAHYLGAAHCVGVGNGLDALTLALLAMKRAFGWKEDAEVIVPDMTFFATAEAVVRAGLVPVFADVDADALLGVAEAEAVRTDKTCAVLPVHLYGHAAPMPELVVWAQTHGLQVLEDAAQAHGAMVGGRRVGTWGTMAAFSFYPGKNLGALGDGGAVVTESEELAACVRMLANYGAAEKYRHELPGMNSRLDEVQAAALRVKLPQLDADNEARRRVAATYAAHIRHPEVVVPYGGSVAGSVFHLYPLRCHRREALLRHLQASGIEVLQHYPLTLSGQPALRRAVSTPRAQAWARQEVSLPISPVLSEAEALQVCEAINSFSL